MTTQVDWSNSYRIIRTIYPPVDLFEDIAEPADWETLVALEAKTNPRIYDEVGNLSLVPVERRINGPSASLAMGAFTHVSKDRPGRFSDGAFGVWYCGDRGTVALAESLNSFRNFMLRTNESACEADYRELTCAVSAKVSDGSHPTLIDPNSWKASQIFAREQRAAGSDGIIYPSVRHPEGMALALFWPDSLRLPIVQARQFRFGWDGIRPYRYLVHGTREWISIP